VVQTLQFRLSAGVEVDLGSVVYHSSQPWPFPQSLMLGFTAAASSAISTPVGLDVLEVTFLDVHTCSCEWL
jgi:NADH pyrophosphatase NudC (nudix superfamily)